MEKATYTSKNQPNNTQTLQLLDQDQLIELILKLQEQIQASSSENETLRAELEKFKEYYRLAAQKRFGRSSEKTDPNQLKFEGFDEAVAIVEEAENPIEEPTVEELKEKRAARRTKGNVGAKKECFADLEVVEVIHDIESKVCDACGSPLRFLKDEVREEIEVIRPRFIVKKHITKIYSCQSCEKTNTEGSPIKKAPAPIPAFPGGFGSVSLVAHILAKKYCEKVPFYRYEKLLADEGIYISRATMANWSISASEKYLEPVYKRLREHLMKQRIIHGDETPFQVLKKDGKSAKSKSYMWHFSSAAVEGRQVSLYMYRPGRHGKYAAEFLAGFEGYLQTDEYAGYNLVPGITRVGCLAHARRKFTDGVTAIPENAKGRNTAAHEGVRRFDELFYLEKKIAHLRGNERYERRLDLVKPKVEALQEWLRKERMMVTPKSKLGEAIAYSLNHWENLTRFLVDGDLERSNNRAERGIKQFVIGRKNDLFSDSVRGAIPVESSLAS
ncbi:Mobile element protein [Clostridiaceae bacterium JG1575]|nr:Mobile element protein [Clostridiaceae bacterium JG1575]